MAGSIPATPTTWQGVNDLTASGVSTGRPSPGAMPRKSSVPPPQPPRDDDTDRRSGQTAGGGGGGDDGNGSDRTGFDDPSEREFPDWVPFRRADVRELGGNDYEHFKGTDGTGGGGHHHKSRIPDASKFPVSVDTLEDLQAVQDSVLANYSMARFDDEYESYVFRGLVDYGGNRMVVDVAIDRWGTPRTIYPVNGDNVRRNDKRGRDGGLVDLDLWFLDNWEPRKA